MLHSAKITLSMMLNISQSVELGKVEIVATK